MEAYYIWKLVTLDSVLQDFHLPEENGSERVMQKKSWRRTSGGQIYRTRQCLYNNMVVYVRELRSAAGLYFLATEFVLTVELAYIVYNCKIYTMQALNSKN